MTEYELTDAIASYTSLTYMNDAGFITITSAYVAMAYMVGDKLSRFQVSFLTFVFIGIQIPGALAIGGYINKILLLIQQLNSLNPTAIETPGDNGVVTAAYLLFRLLIVIGCLVFMWQVRHSKTR